MASVEHRIKALARNHRRRFLRRAGLRAGDLDAIALAQLETFARCQARLDLWDEGGGPTDKTYLTAANTATRALRLLEIRMKELGLIAGKPVQQRGAALARYLNEREGLR